MEVLPLIVITQSLFGPLLFFLFCCHEVSSQPHTPLDKEGDAIFKLEEKKNEMPCLPHRDRLESP